LFDVDVALDRASANDFDALLLPGGVMNPGQAADQFESRAVREGVLRRETANQR